MSGGAWAALLLLPLAQASAVSGPFTTTSNFSASISSRVPPRTVTAFGSVYTDVSYTSVSIAPTGTGSAYASKCAQIQWSYSAASDAFEQAHQTVSNQTIYYGGPSTSLVTYYANASTACDGHARVSYSPAIAASSSLWTTTIVPTAPPSISGATMDVEFPISTPACSIDFGDCDDLYSAYTSSMSVWSEDSPASPSPSIPPCVNSSEVAAQASLDSYLTACGPCTLFGVGVQLLYFPVPTTVSRDMCASTPSAALTSYGTSVGDIYTAGPRGSSANAAPTGVIGNRTFTSGTAYISISSVWAEDRCSSTLGSPVTDAILALPSESLLSLRYSQDHFQYFGVVTTQTGYPFDYADLNKPVPWSAWNGQNECDCSGWGCGCDVIYENDFNPQLAIPPGIKKLSPEFANCQVWYNGLYDPPHTLKSLSVFATPTKQKQEVATTPAASPSSTAAPVQGPTVSASSDAAAASTTTGASASSDSAAVLSQTDNAEPVSTFAPITISGSSVEPSDQTVGGAAILQGGPGTVIGDVTVSAARNGIIIDGTTISTGGCPTDSATATLQIGNGSQPASATAPGQAGEEVAYTMQNGEIVSIASGAGTDGEYSVAVVSSIAAASDRAVTFTANGKAFTAMAHDGSTMLAFDGSSVLLVPGVAATISDATIGLASQGIVADGATHALSAASATVGVVLTDGSNTVTAVENSGVAVVAGTTISTGGAALTLADGDAVSLASGGSIVLSGASSTTSRALESTGQSTVALLAATSAGNVTTTAGTSTHASTSGARPWKPSGWVAVLLACIALAI